jgi:hypothetical protein
MEAAVDLGAAAAAAIGVSRLGVLAPLHSAAASVSKAFARQMREPAVPWVIRAVGAPVRLGMLSVPATMDPRAVWPVAL